MPCRVTICAKIAKVDKNDFFFDSDYELIKQFISINLVEISSKRVNFLGVFVSSHIIVITATWHTSKVLKAS